MASAEGGTEVVVVRHDNRIVDDAVLDADGGQQFELIIVPASRVLPASLCYLA